MGGSRSHSSSSVDNACMVKEAAMVQRYSRNSIEQGHVVTEVVDVGRVSLLEDVAHAW